MADKKLKVRYVSQGVSAPAEWWEDVEKAAEDLGLNPGGRSRLIREAVDIYLKAGGRLTEPEVAMVA